MITARDITRIDVHHHPGGAVGLVDNLGGTLTLPSVDVLMNADLDAVAETLAAQHNEGVTQPQEDAAST